MTFKLPPRTMGAGGGVGAAGDDVAAAEDESADDDCGDGALLSGTWALVVTTGALVMVEADDEIGDEDGA